MIVITGPGRSGTSFLAELYAQVGFSPGGTWIEANRGGWESQEIVDANQRLLRELGITAYGPPSRYKQLSEFVGRRLAGMIKNRLDDDRRQRIRSAADRTPFRTANSLSLMPFERMDEVVSAEGEALRRVADAYDVTKDPLFSWTLPVWLRAGADVSHVVISTRNVDETLASHEAAAHFRFRSPSDAKNSLLYSLGATLWACIDHGVPYTIVRYPDFLSDPAALHAQLVFPKPVALADFEAAFRSVYRPSLVEAYRRGPDPAPA